MTNPTTNPDLIAAIKKLDKHVPWYEWCDLSESLVGSQSASEFVQNPNACEAAVVMYAGELRAWLPRPMRTDFWYHKVEAKWRWRLWMSGTTYRQGEKDTQPEASLALLTAVRDAMKGGG